MDIGSTVIGYRGPDDLLPGFMVIWARMFYFATTRLNLVVLEGNMQSHEGEPGFGLDGFGGYFESAVGK